jgi:hypothetical protein
MSVGCTGKPVIGFLVKSGLSVPPARFILGQGGCPFQFAR